LPESRSPLSGAGAKRKRENLEVAEKSYGDHREGREGLTYGLKKKGGCHHDEVRGGGKRRSQSTGSRLDDSVVSRTEGKRRTARSRDQMGRGGEKVEVGTGKKKNKRRKRTKASSTQKLY